MELDREVRNQINRVGYGGAALWAIRELGLAYRDARELVRSVTINSGRTRSRFQRNIQPGDPVVRQLALESASDTTMEYIGGSHGDSGGFYTGQFRSGRSTFGKYKSAIVADRKLDRRDSTYEIERFGAMNSMHDAAGGFYKLAYTVGTTTSDYPLYALDLTSRRYGTETIPSTIKPPFCMMGAIGATNEITFGVVQGHSNDGATLNSNWDVVKGNGHVQNTGATAVLQYSHVRVLARCPTSLPGLFKIQLIQVKEGLFSPDAIVAANVARTSFFEQYMSGAIFNPLSRGVGATQRASQNIRVLKTWVHKSSPDSKDNQDANGSQYLFDLFLNLNRYCQFRRLAGVAMADDTFINDDHITAQNDANNVFNYVINPRARLYLLISSTATPNSPFSAANHFSFDLEVRNKWVYRGH